MPNIRTVKQWMDKLNPSLKKKALKNIKDQYPNDLKDKKSYFSEAIDVFMWDETPEGHDFWQAIYVEAKKLERGHQEYYIVVEYPFDFNLSLDKPIEQVAKNLKLEESGSGSGFGVRDKSFTVHSKESKIDDLVKKFRKKLNERTKKRIKVSYNDCNYPNNL